MERLNGCGKSSAHLHAADMQRTRTVRIVSAGACGLRDFRGSLSPDLVLKSPNESAICRDLGVFSDSECAKTGDTMKAISNTRILDAICVHGACRVQMQIGVKEAPTVHVAISSYNYPKTQTLNPIRNPRSSETQSFD